jgi:hypothetical protein
MPKGLFWNCTSKPDILSTQDFFRQVIEEVAAVKPVQTGILLNMLHTADVRTHLLNLLLASA